MPLKKIKYNLLNHNDSRGSFAEFIKADHFGQISIFKANKNHILEVIISIILKIEKFLVINGKAKFYMKDVSSNQKIELILNDKLPNY